MTISVQNLLIERRYPFIASLFLLLLFVCFFILSTNTSQPPPLYRVLQPSSHPTVTQNISSTTATVPVLEIDGKKSNIATDRDLDDSGGGADLVFEWELCPGPLAVDYIPCLDNYKAIKSLKSRRHMEHRERHCPKPNPRCLIPLPVGYKVPVPWPKSRDMIWLNNVPHLKLVEYKKEQNWVKRSGDYLLFPGGGTQFKEGVTHYIQYIEKNLPKIGWGKRTRVILDVGCGVASFGGYLLDKDVITMSFAPKDEHEAQIQFALERGIPATLSVIGTQRLTFPDNAFDLIHCARCRTVVIFMGELSGGNPLLELNRILRPGGVFVWSATPVYRNDERDKKVWDGECSVNSRRVFLYAPLDGCISAIPLTETGSSYGWPTPWPERLKSKPASLSTEQDAERIFHEDTKHWSELVANVYLGGLGVNWSSVRNVMDMNAGYGGFAAALTDLPLWVMNVIPVNGPDTLPVIFDRGLIGIYHDWCESLSTYPRSYDLLHSSFLFGNLTQRCEMLDGAVEMDRILRPGGVVIVEDTIEILNKLRPILHSLHWSVNLHQQRFLVGRK
ncbi:hypothetical protein Ccrd_011633, partial [Cynara cardunculus var. scolymus]